MTKQQQDTIALHAATRKNVRSILKAHTLDQANTIPAGMNNNLIWNAGHVIATMELLTYGLAGLRTPSGKEFIDRYRKGTRPEGPADQAEYDLILDKLKVGGVQLAADLEHLDFGNFKEYGTSYGVTLTDVGDALAFNNMHEAMHIGTMLALRNLL